MSHTCSTSAGKVASVTLATRATTAPRTAGRQLSAAGRATRHAENGCRQPATRPVVDCMVVVGGEVDGRSLGPESVCVRVAVASASGRDAEGTVVRQRSGRRYHQSSSGKRGDTGPLGHSSNHRLACRVCFAVCRAEKPSNWSRVVQGCPLPRPWWWPGSGVTQAAWVCWGCGDDHLSTGACTHVAIGHVWANSAARL